MSAATLVMVAGTARRRPRTRADGSPFSRAAAGERSGDLLDPDRFAAFVSRYQARVHRLVAGILGPGYAREAEDATQEVFLHAYRKLDTFRGDSRLSTWLDRLAYNRAIDYRRKMDRRREQALTDEEPSAAASVAAAPTPARPSSPLRSALAGERFARVRQALEELTPKQRTAVHLHYWLGCSIQEIAELMDEKPATVKSHLFRARRALAPRLENER